MKTTSTKSGLVRILAADSIQPTPENDRLYRPIDPQDPEIKALADSIRAHGVMEPLVLSTDRWILSGHRRFAAARLAGLTELPCRIDPLISKEDNLSEFVRRLREYNRQRVKTNEETLREEIVSANPEDSYRVLVEQRKAKSQITAESNMVLG